MTTEQKLRGENRRLRDQLARLKANLVQLQIDAPELENVKKARFHVHTAREIIGEYDSLAPITAQVNSTIALLDETILELEMERADQGASILAGEGEL